MDFRNKFLINFTGLLDSRLLPLVLQNQKNKLNKIMCQGNKLFFIVMI